MKCSTRNALAFKNPLHSKITLFAIGTRKQVKGGREFAHKHLCLWRLSGLAYTRLSEN